MRTAIRVAFLYKTARLVYQRVICGNSGKGTELFCKIRSFKTYGVPRENARGEGLTLAGECGIYFFYDAILLFNIFPAIKPRTVFDRAIFSCRIPYLVGSVAEKRRQPKGKNIILFVVISYYVFGYFICRMRHIHIIRKISRHKKLMLCAVFGYFNYFFKRFFQIVKGDAPEGDIKFHRILGG